MSNPFENLPGVLGYTSVSEQLQQLRLIEEQLTAQQNVNAAAKSAGSSAPASSSNGASWLEQAGGILGGGLGMASLVSGLAGLFNRSDENSAPFEPVAYMQPLPIQLDAGFSRLAGGSALATDAGPGNLPRPLMNPSTLPPPSVPDGAGPQITVNVQAFDSKSFLDHSNEIALAVRQAMLETTVLNDVIREV